MAASSNLELDELVERRYLGLVRLARSLAEASDWQQLAAAISHGLEETLHAALDGPPGIRLWASTSEGFDELGRYPAEHDFAHLPLRELQRSAKEGEPTGAPGGGLLVGLHAGGISLGVVEVAAPEADAELLAHAAPVIACRLSLLAGQGVGDVLLSPLSLDGSDEAAALMSTFAVEAKHLLDHDRLSAYLLTCDGRAFERFAVATSAIIPGEGVIIPFEEVGLRHIVLTNRALVSRDLSTDPRIVGREDRLIARAGFQGLLSVPLRVRGRPIGVLNFVSRTPAFYTEKDIPIAQQIADQIAAFMENLHVQQRMRTLIRHEAAEQERTRVARELYHAVAQAVPAIENVAEDLRDRLAECDPEASRQAEQVRELARQELAEVRRAVADMLPRGLDSQNLEEALRATLASLGRRDPKPALKVKGDSSRLSGAARRGAYRIFQEALTNVRQHAGAGNVRVALEADRDLVLTVTDDGRGFDREEGDGSGGMGLQFMRERAQALGGLLEIESAAGRGTSVRFELLGARDAAPEVHTPEDSPELSGPPHARLRVFVAERHPLTRAGLARLLEEASDMRVVGEAAGADEARGKVKRLRPDVVLLDAHLPDGDLENLAEEIHVELPGTAIVVLSEFPTGHEAEMAEAGVGGFLHKLVGGPELTEAVRAVATGASIGPPLPAPGSNGHTLSPRERSILGLVVAGQTNTEIGKTLFLATKTIERQVATIVRKLGARNRAHAAAIAVSRRIVELPPPADSSDAAASASETA